MAFCAPNYFVDDKVTLSSDYAANVGNTIGGLMSPFIAIGAAVLTFIAFWVQHTANQEMLKNNAKLQIEQQFYEMLKIHREMVNEFDFGCAGVGDQVKEHYDVGLGNVCFLDKIYKITGEKQNITNVHYRGQRAILMYLKEFMFTYECLKEEGMSLKENFEKAYELFFEGLEDCSLDEEKKNKLLVIRDAIHWRKKENVFVKSELFKKYNFPQFVIFEGHRSNFNPYYRHLYLIVKKIVNDNVFNNKEKMSYLGILRAQMTSEEQMLLFYNWFSDYGYQWEEECGNRFFSKYKMIHNIDEKYWKFLGVNCIDCFPWVTKEEMIGLFEFFEQKIKKTNMFDFYFRQNTTVKKIILSFVNKYDIIKLSKGQSSQRIKRVVGLWKKIIG